MSRPTLDLLRTRLRRMIGDDGDTFSDDELDAILDRWAETLVNLPLQPIWEGVGASRTARRWRLPLPAWEADAVVHDGSVPVSLRVSDWVAGWVEVDPRTAPLYVNGRSYDLAGAAADALEEWAARLARAYDVSSDGQSLARSQQARALLTAAQQFRAQQRPRTGVLQRPEDLW